MNNSYAHTRAAELFEHFGKKYQAEVYRELAEPGFKTVSIEPKLGKLKFVKATMPHPEGMIQLDLERTGKTGIEGTATLPDKLYGTFIWEGQSIKLSPGEQKIDFPH